MIGFLYFSYLKNCQVSPTEKIYIGPIYSQFTCLSDNLFRSEQFFKEQARDTEEIVAAELIVEAVVTIAAHAALNGSHQAVWGVLVMVTSRA